jgi:hypothetical protein
VEDSKYKLVGLGIAAEAKTEGLDWNLEVTPLEQLPLLDGQLTNRGVAMETSGTDSSGKQYADKAVTSTSVNAVWKGTGESNRRTCPNVFVGEEVLIWTFEETGDYFWEPRNTNSHKRTLETVTNAYAANPAGGDEERNDTNSYIVDVSTHRKVITISTSQMNNEKSTFKLQIDGGNGITTLADNCENEFNISSLENRISMMNGEGVEVHLHGKNLKIVVPGNVDETVTGNVTETIAGGLNITVTGSANIQAETATITSSQNTINGNTTINGNLEVTGSQAILGGLEVTGAAAFPGGHGPH